MPLDQHTRLLLLMIQRRTPNTDEEQREIKEPSPPVALDRCTTLTHWSSKFPNAVKLMKEADPEVKKEGNENKNKKRSASRKGTRPPKQNKGGKKGDSSCLLYTSDAADE